MCVVYTTEVKVLKFAQEVDQFRSEWRSVMDDVSRLKTIIDTVHEELFRAHRDGIRVPASLVNPLKDLKKYVVTPLRRRKLNAAQLHRRDTRCHGCLQVRSLWTTFTEQVWWEYFLSWTAHGSHDHQPERLARLCESLPFQHELHGPCLQCASILHKYLRETDLDTG